MGKKRKSRSSSLTITPPSSKPKRKPERKPKRKPERKPKPEPEPEPEPKPKPKHKPIFVSDSDSDSDEEQPSSSSSSDQIEQPSSSSSSPSTSSSSSSSSEDEASKRNSIKALLEPLTRDQLTHIIIKNPSIVADFESDPIHRKLFVYNLGPETTSDSLAAFFSQFGAVQNSAVVADKTSGRSKGYGFLTFASRSAACRALREPRKKLGSRIASCQLAAARAGAASARKLHVSNVGPQVCPEKLREFFAEFGEIDQGPVGLDKATGKFRGFAIFVYKTEDGVKKALEEPEKVFDGFKMQCSLAVAKDSVAGTKQATTAVAVSGGAETRDGSLVQLPVYNPGEVAVSGGAETRDGSLVQLPVYNPGAVFMGHNPGFGVYGMAYPPAAFGPALNMRVGTTPAVGGYGMEPSVSGTSTSVVGSYGTQAALQGYGIYQSAYMGQPSASGAATRPQLAVGGYGMQSVSGMSTSVIGSYGTQAAMQGYGIYQSAHMGQPSASGSAATRPQLGSGTAGATSSFYGL